MQKTLEDRMRALEDAVIALSNILEARVGGFDEANIDQRISQWGSLVHKWAAEVGAGRSES